MQRFLPIHRVCHRAAAAALGIALLGCGESGGSRVAVSGNVTRQGAPLEQGFISLRPKSGHSGPAANADIRDGRYAFTGGDGPAPGPYDVLINVAAVGGKAVGSAPQVEGRQWRFEMRVPDAGEFDADFELESP